VPFCQNGVAHGRRAFWRHLGAKRPLETRSEDTDSCESVSDRSLITVAALITGGNTEQLRGHLMRAKDNGLTETELKEVITHLAFYAGWPKAMSAITVAKRVFDEQ